MSKKSVESEPENQDKFDFEDWQEAGYPQIDAESEETEEGRQKAIFFIKSLFRRGLKRSGNEGRIFWNAIDESNRLRRIYPEIVNEAYEEVTGKSLPDHLQEY